MIHTTETAKYYAAFYFVAFAIAFVLKLVEGKKRGYPLITWLSLCILAHVIFVIGTKAITLSVNDWQQIFTSFQLPVSLKRSLLGGLLSFIFVYFVARYFFKFKNDFLDAVTIPSVVALAVQRAGCFLGGCCFGKTTTLPWGISFDVGSPAYICQVNDGLIPLTSNASLPVHPVQLYYVLSGFLMVAILLFVRKKLKIPGNLFLLSIALFAFSRFIIEFFVDRHGDQIGGQIFIGLKMVQWVVLAVSISTTLLFFRNEKRVFSNNCINTSISDSYTKSFLLILFSLTMFLTFRNWFSIMEFHMLSSLFLVAFSIISISLYNQFSKPIFKLVHISLALSMLLLMSQTIDTTRNGKPQYTRYKSFGTEFSLGRYQNSTHEICNNTSYQHQFQAATISYSGTRIRTDMPYRRREMGIKFNVGNDNYIVTSGNQANLNSKNDVLIGINPYLEYNWRFAGLSTGLLLGNYANTFNFPVIPQLGLRLGPENIMYVKGEMFTNTLGGSNFPMFSTMIGSGLGKFNNNAVEFGYGISDVDQNLLILSGNYLYNNYIVIKPKLMLGNGNNFMATFGLSFKLN